MAKSNKIMIQVCLCGAGTKKAQAPTVPYTADELAEQLDFPDWYGGNLDALYDCLTDLTEETSIILLHSQALAETLGTSYGRFCRVLTDAAAENPNLHIQI